MGLAPQPHPKLPNSARKIDFMTTAGDPVYVECVTVGHSDASAGRRSRTASVEAAIDEVGIYDYWLDLGVERVGAQSLATAPLVDAVRSWLLSLDVDEVAASGRSPLLSPSFTWEHSGWELSIEVIARSPELRGNGTMRPLAITAEEGPEKPLWLAIRGQLELKCDAYGDLDAPYVIAVNAPDAFENDPGLLSGVYGLDAFKQDWRRDGFFLRTDGIDHSNVSGALLASALQPATFTRQVPALYENPAAKRSVPSDVLWHRVRVRSDRMEEAPGIHPTALFGLPSDWPGKPWPSS
jgi:hypothetical protein